VKEAEEEEEEVSSKSNSNSSSSSSSSSVTLEHGGTLWPSLSCVVPLSSLRLPPFLSLSLSRSPCRSLRALIFMAAAAAAAKRAPCGTLGERRRRKRRRWRRRRRRRRRLPARERRRKGHTHPSARPPVDARSSPENRARFSRLFFLTDSLSSLRTAPHPVPRAPRSRTYVRSVQVRKSRLARTEREGQRIERS
jgi:hypothetical protein